ncbi:MULTISPECIES: SDR family oxidoreductase [Noviherbaspirillum]|uniref:SDR family oxidoreductase n=1 Tax=Noviherbaspirillum TaxID=1344552 RepID=UPI00124BEE09|nr:MULTISPECIES: SDR family oxidoreductase [Noviherbaspirillum]
MKIRDKVVVVTGGGNGIGAAMARRFAAEGARAVVVADLDGTAASKVASEIGGMGMAVNVAREQELAELVASTVATHGHIDLFCSNAGVSIGNGLESSDADWEKAWSVNLMAHVYAARAVVPHMLERGEGYLLQTASAAGLLSISDASYAVTKHGAVAFAEWLSITYGDRGIKVSCFCPMGVRTNMLLGSVSEVDQPALLAAAVEPADAAEAIVQGIDAERFLILTHPEVLEYMRRKGADYDRWLKGMRRYQQQPPSTKS